MASPSAANGYSARVRLELHVGSACYPLAQIGADRLIFEKPISLPGSAGEVFAHIDDHEHRWIATWEPTGLPRKTVPVQLRMAAEPVNSDPA